MFERFTDPARRVVIFAEAEARLLDHDRLGTGHVLLGLLRSEEGIAAQALSSLGVGLDRTRATLERLVGRGPGMPHSHVPLTAGARRVFDLSLREAQELGDSYVGTEHILLGLVRGAEGTAPQVLLRMGVDISQIEQAVMDILDAEDAPATAPAEVSEAWATPTPLVASAVDGVSYEAVRRRHLRTGSEHVLLWLLNHPEGGALRALRAEGIEIASLRSRLERMLGATGDSTDP